MPEKAVSQGWEIVKTLIPISTFVLGYLLKWSQDFIKERRITLRIRLMLLTEISTINEEAEKLYNSSFDDTSHSLVIGLLTNLTSVYNAFLPQLSRLNEQEIDKIYNAYAWLRLMSMEAATIKSLAEKDGEVRNSFAQRVRPSLAQVIRVTSEALQELKKHSRQHWRRFGRRREGEKR